MRHAPQSPAAACPVEDRGGGAALPVPGPPPSRRQGCCSAADAADAERVAALVDIPFYTLNLQQEFQAIIDYFVAEYTAGRTPNPCIVCNHRVKFGRLFDYADSIGTEYVATGHYARLVRGGGDDPPELWCGADPAKDQSYVCLVFNGTCFGECCCR